jgi:hypothetical protein
LGIREGRRRASDFFLIPNASSLMPFFFLPKNAPQKTFPKNKATPDHSAAAAMT